MFPWLAALAAGYEKYRFRRLSYFYRSMAPTTANGLVYMAIDYDPSDTDVNDITPRTLTQMYGSTQANVYLSHEIRVKCDAKPRLTGSKSANASINDYILGSFYYLLSDSSINTGLGQLYVDYEVELIIQ